MSRAISTTTTATTTTKTQSKKNRNSNNGNHNHNRRHNYTTTTIIKKQHYKDNGNDHIIIGNDKYFSRLNYRMKSCQKTSDPKKQQKH